MGRYWQAMSWLKMCSNLRGVVASCNVYSGVFSAPGLGGSSVTHRLFRASQHSTYLAELEMLGLYFCC